MRMHTGQGPSLFWLLRKAKVIDKTRVSIPNKSVFSSCGYATSACKNVNLKG